MQSLAVIMADNVLVIHAQLTAYPEVALFVSPILVYVAAPRLGPARRAYDLPHRQMQCPVLASRVWRKLACLVCKRYSEWWFVGLIVCHATGSHVSNQKPRRLVPQQDTRHETNVR